MINKTMLAGAFLAVSLFNPIANAAVASFSDSFSLIGDKDFMEEPDNFNFLYGVETSSLSALPQFDPGTGVLNSVAIKLDGVLSYGIDVMGGEVVDESAPNSIEVGVQVGAGVMVPMSGGRYLKAFDLVPETVNCFAEENQGSCLETVFFDQVLVLTEDGLTGSEMDAFIGTGSLSALDVNLLLGITAFTSDNVIDPIAFVHGDFEGTVTVEYDYSAVPVPAAAWLFGSAMLGLVGLKRRK